MYINEHSAHCSQACHFVFPQAQVPSPQRTTTLCSSGRRSNLLQAATTFSKDSSRVKVAKFFVPSNVEILALALSSICKKKKKL